MSKDNPNPLVYSEQILLTQEQEQDRKQKELNSAIQDEIDNLEIFELIRHIQDPEYDLSLEQLKIVNTDHIVIENGIVAVQFTPTIPHCSMAQTIGLYIKVKLIRSLPKKFKIDVFIRPGTHQLEQQVNKQINDKERVAAALENDNVKSLVKKGIFHSDRFPELPKLKNKETEVKDLNKKIKKQIYFEV